MHKKTVELDKPDNWIVTYWEGDDLSRMTATRREFRVGPTAASADIDNYWEWRRSPHGWQAQQFFTGHGGMGWEGDDPMICDLTSGMPRPIDDEEFIADI